MRVSSSANARVCKRKAIGLGYPVADGSQNGKPWIPAMDRAVVHHGWDPDGRGWVGVTGTLRWFAAFDSVGLSHLEVFEDEGPHRDGDLPARLDLSFWVGEREGKDRADGVGVALQQERSGDRRVRDEETGAG